MDDLPNDPYRSCEQHCNHDLARGIAVEELLEDDGPFPPTHLIVNFSLQRAIVIDHREEAREAV
ncbi:MAG: hypothetical protein ACE5KX_04195 [Acidimicrobiia bacterium]